MFNLSALVIRMTMTEDRLFATIAQPISVMNILLNILLIVVIRLKSGKEMSAYKHILTLQTLLSLGFASLQAVSLPYWISVPGAFVLMPTGILRDTPYGAWVCYVLCGLCGEVNVMLATTFLFNYINMCK
ncbi:unnamed protein product, partial [Mesorhabditis belari]|uniref:Uncharacterized protein n=1 Tax=Mesorhabditis belari TaxID=2138241 RepID=A0AAF3FDB2_9BILA